MYTGLIVFVVLASFASAQESYIYAHCDVAPNSMMPDAPNIRGRIEFAQLINGGATAVAMNVTGLIVPSNTHKKHGFHIHANGDLSNGCTSTGPHFNPDNLVHGGPEDIVRHAGDLGNIEPDSNGVILTRFMDSYIGLRGGYNIIGRAVVIHEKIDDLGRGGDEESSKTGNAGPRLACCIIGRTDGKYWN